MIINGNQNESKIEKIVKGTVMVTGGAVSSFIFGPIFGGIISGCGAHEIINACSEPTNNKDKENKNTGKKLDIQN